MTVSARRFTCLGCGADVYRPESDRFDDSMCLNCRFGPAGSEAAIGAVVLFGDAD